MRKIQTPGVGVHHITLASYRFEPPAGFTHAEVLLEHKLRVERGAYTIVEEHLADAIEALIRRSRESLSDDRDLKDPDASGEEHMAANKLNILEPSVNNMCVRVFVRAAGLDFEEENVWGKTTSPEYLAKSPVHLTPTLEEGGLPRERSVRAARSWRTSATNTARRSSIPPIQASARWSTTRCSI